MATLWRKTRFSKIARLLRGRSLDSQSLRFVSTKFVGLGTRLFTRRSPMTSWKRAGQLLACMVLGTAGCGNMADDASTSQAAAVGGQFPGLVAEADLLD